MSYTAEIEIEETDVLDEMSISEIEDYLADRIGEASEHAVDGSSDVSLLNSICRRRTRRYLDRETVREIVNQVIDEQF